MRVTGTVDLSITDIITPPLLQHPPALRLSGTTPVTSGEKYEIS